MGFYRRELRQVDAATGEVVEGKQVLIPPKHRLSGDFIMAMQEGFLRLAGDEELTRQDFRVLLSYMGNLDFENFIQVKQQYIADSLGIKRQRVCESTKKLVEKGILIKGPKVGKHITYRLNAFYGWKGKADKKYWETCEEHLRKVP
jgi:hypothetical protein